jgi:diketogulonate reductase-like aldo/keto reductase
MTTLNDTYTLNTGATIPKIGFGTWQIPNGDDAYNSVMFALNSGYRHIDTARVYGNEESVGKAIKDSGIAREDIFLTTKLPAEIKNYEGAIEAFETSLQTLGVEYVDLYLIHAPWPWSEQGADYTDGKSFITAAAQKQLEYQTSEFRIFRQFLIMEPLNQL